MRILHLFQPVDGGVPRYLELIVPRFYKEGIEQGVIYPIKYPISHLQDYCINTFNLDLEQTFNPAKIFKVTKEIRKIIKTFNPDILYCHSSFAGVYGRLAAIGCNCKVIYNPHGWAFNRQKKSDIIFLLIEKLFSNLTDQIVCISEAEKTSALNHHIATENKLALIPNGINIDAVAKANPINKSSLGIGENTFVVGMIGRLSTQKAPDVFIKAAKIIQEHIPNSAFIIVGNGEEEDAIKTYAKENNLNLTITGWTDKPYDYLKIFDVAVLLSRWEGFGLAIVEYMAAGKPVVATRVDAIPTLIDDGIDGLLVNVDDPKDAAEKVLWLHAHPKGAATMRNNALGKVQEKYDIQRVINQHIAMFKQLAGGGN